MRDCIFCQIVHREQPAAVVTETHQVLGIRPREPVAPGHVLLLPKRHAVDLLDIDPDDLTALIVEAQRLAERLRRDVAATGVNLLHASCEDAQQSVFHLHLHVVPCFHDDGLDLWLISRPP